jgi:predicted metalloprotease with PDZ domain
MKKPSSAVHYRVEVHDLHAHLWSVTLTIAQPSELQVLQLPVWIPGSYLVREFAKQVLQVRAVQKGQSLIVQQTDKATWQIEATPGQALVVSYVVHAFDNSVRTAWLDAQRGFFNPTSLCLRVWGQTDLPHVLELPAVHACPHWRVATSLRALKTNAQGFGRYTAANYDELADAPVEMSDFWSGHFTSKGVPHRVVISDRGLKEGQLEYQHRRDAAATKVASAEVLAFLRDLGAGSAPCHLVKLVLLGEQRELSGEFYVGVAVIVGAVFAHTTLKLRSGSS